MSTSVPADGYAPGRRLRLSRRGEPLVVGQLLAKGGQGYVYEVMSDPLVVFKQIRPEALRAGPNLERKVAAMVVDRPAGWRESSGHVLLAWPEDSVVDGSRFVGFTMPRIEAKDAAELHVLANPSDRRDPAPRTPPWVCGFTWDYLLQTSANLALATDALHEARYVFGDFNERNILVTRTALVTFIDCDSMQVPNRAGRDFLCEVGRPEFTAPELLKLDLKSVSRKPSSDLFPLAVHIHQLLLEGVHPFDGVWNGRGEKPRRAHLATDGLYAYAGNRLLSPPPSAIAYGLLPASIRDLFRRAFVAGASNPALRPTGDQWRSTLSATLADLKTCMRDPRHIYPDHHEACPWCQYEATRARPRQTPLPGAQGAPSPTRARTSTPFHPLAGGPSPASQAPAKRKVPPGPRTMSGPRAVGQARVHSSVVRIMVYLVAGSAGGTIGTLASWPILQHLSSGPLSFAILLTTLTLPVLALWVGGMTALGQATADLPSCIRIVIAATIAVALAGAVLSGAHVSLGLLLVLESLVLAVAFGLSVGAISKP